MAQLKIYKFKKTGNIALPDRMKLIKTVDLGAQVVTADNCGDVLTTQAATFLLSINDSRDGMDGDLGFVDVWSKNDNLVYRFTFDAKTKFDLLASEGL